MTTFVLGGGTAGIVAALGLADRGHRVVLLESRGWLGGRAFSSHDRATDERLDNGPHAMLGCYGAMRRLIARIGTTDRFDRQRSLAMAYRRAGGDVDRLRLSRLPAPLAMPAALLRLRLPFAQKLAALRGMAASLFGAPASWSVGDWLARRGQLGGPDALLWVPLCRAIMNVEPEAASARLFLRTLREAFAGSAAAAAFWLPKQPWSEVLGEPAAAALAAAGAEVRCGARIEGIEAAGGVVTRLRTSGGDVEVASDDLVVSALPWFALHKLLPQLPAVGELAAAPIVSAFFRLDAAVPEPPDDGPVVALVGGEPFHFLLRTPGAPRRSFALLSGGSRAFDGLSVEAIEAIARRQLASYVPQIPVDVAGTVRIRKENLATFVAAPGAVPARPRPGRVEGGPRNLLVCGDWTDTGLPATLEGAARSAEAVVAVVAAGRG